MSTSSFSRTGRVKKKWLSYSRASGGRRTSQRCVPGPPTATGTVTFSSDHGATEISWSKLNFLSSVTVTRPGERVAAEIADGDFQRHGVAGQHLGLRRPGVQDGVVVELGRPDVHEEQLGRRRQHLEIRVGPFFPREIGEVIDFRPRRPSGPMRRAAAVLARLTSARPSPGLSRFRKRFASAKSLEKCHEAARPVRVHEQEVDGVLRRRANPCSLGASCTARSREAGPSPLCSMLTE